MAQKVMYPGMVNSPETTITNGISESDTIIYVLDPARVPEPPNLMTLGTGTNAETIKVTEINDSAITVERGFQGIAKSWPAGTVIARNFTEYDYGALKDNIEDLDASKETPAGAQAKADAAQAAANAYTDQEVGDLAGEGRTTETVKGNADALAAHLSDTAPHEYMGGRPFVSSASKIYYIDAVAGNDTNDGLTAGTAFATWAKANNLIPRVLLHTYVIRIIGNLSEQIDIPPFVATSVSGLLLRGDTDIASNHAVSGITINSVLQRSDYPIINYLRINGELKIINSACRLDNIEPRNTGSLGAILTRFSNVYVYNYDIGTSVVQLGIWAADGSIIFSRNGSGNATSYGLQAMSSIIHKYDAVQPTGAIANEYTLRGGVIR